MLVVVGAGGHGSDVVDLALRCGTAVAGALDDNRPELDRLSQRGVVVIGGVRDLPADARFSFGIGYPQPRASVAAVLPDAAHPPLVDPSAVVSPTADLHAGVQVFWQAAVSPLVVMEEHSLVSYGATVGHDTRIGRFTTVMPGARLSGDVTIGERVLVGSGAVVLQGLHIGDDAVIGAGAVVVADVPPGATVVGIPARTRLRGS